MGIRESLTAVINFIFAGLGKCFRFGDASVQTQTELQSEVKSFRHENISLQQQNDDLKREAHLLVQSKNALELKVEKIQRQLCGELKGNGSYADGQPSPFLLESTLKTLQMRVSCLTKGLLLDKGVFLQHFKSLKTSPGLQLKTHFNSAFLTRPTHVTYMLKAWLFDIFFKDFENESFQSGGPTLLLDRNQRRTESYKYFQQITAIGARSDLFIDNVFKEFCLKKFLDFLSLWHLSFVNHGVNTHLFHMYMDGLCNRTALELEGTRNLIQSFVSAAKIVWALHKLCLSFEPRADIFRVHPGTDLEDEYMDSVVLEDDDEKFVSKVGFMISPGFLLQRSIIKCQIYLAGERVSWERKFDIMN